MLVTHVARNEAKTCGCEDKAGRTEVQVCARQRAKLADRVDSEIQVLLLPSGAGIVQATAQPVQQPGSRKAFVGTTVAATDCHPCIGPLYNGYPTWLVARVHCELPPGVHGLGPYQDLLVKAKRFDFHKQTAIDVDFAPTLPEPHQAIPVASHLAPLSYMQASHLRMPSETTRSVESPGQILAEENCWALSGMPSGVPTTLKYGIVQDPNDD